MHKAMEEWERSGRTLGLETLRGIYIEEFQRSIDDQARHTPNFSVWFGSGPYGPEEDITRRFGLGWEQTKGLIQWSLNHPEVKIWETPDGDPAIELEFFVELGGVTVKGYIDQIVETPKGLVVRDIKTGAKPGDAFQLAVYAEAMKQLHGVDINRGDYFMGKTMKPTRLIPITPEERARTHEEFKWLETQITEQNFEAKPSRQNCQMCDVASSCQYKEW